eukprot:CAMPEP_0174372166 /NCGR_PEP_ID=MMETSP0811_2-20130205/102568_1 /TAXON_ID=73025 ORGANISM="Eutreptiella gymnastica-like, Strain CCMP1594" /NCGR_SAMPLE_ID=MMETSP0811_2 /ASSEMBLY_ACC=CAM_ASM_000667 /LENGTH=66 /DNA_ID=CAMNT_0015519299 /DNA_START=698 /DNA_END=898 /DNA_ORIENTATION=-
MQPPLDHLMTNDQIGAATPQRLYQKRVLTLPDETRKKCSEVDVGAALRPHGSPVGSSAQTAISHPP